MDFKKLFRDIRWIGLDTALATLRYSFHRDQINRKYHQPFPVTNERPIDVVNTTRIESGVIVKFLCEKRTPSLEVKFLAPDLVRLSWDQGIPPIPYAIAKSDWASVKLNYQVTEDEYILSSDQLTVAILSDGGIQFSSPDGMIIREELPPEFQGSQWIHRALLEPGESIFGLGERAATFNLRGGKYGMWNTDPFGAYETGSDPLYLCIPVYLSLTSNYNHLVFYENSYPGTFAFSETAEAHLEGGMLRYYFFTGTLENIYHRYAELTGCPPLPPKWTLGYHQSRWGYKNESDILEVVNGFKVHDIPLSAIHLDIDYMNGYRVFTINETRFPDLPRMVKELNDSGVKVVPIIDPGIKVDREYPLFNECIEKDLLCTLPDGSAAEGVVWPGKSIFPDFTNPRTRVWWAKQYEELFKCGISGLWHDMNEPTSFKIWGKPSLPTSVRHNMEGRKGDHLEAHNLYGLLMCQAGLQAFKQHRPGIRPWILTRSGWAGIQRYAWSWTADTKTCWNNLRQSLRTVLGLTLSGQPYSGPDIGGFSEDTTPELYIRWLQLSSFMPFFRTHSSLTTLPREPWKFGESTLVIARDFIKLRYALLPYIYTLAWQNSQNGTPIVRPFFWETHADPSSHDIDDAFFLGSDILVAPVLDEGATIREIILPPGRWYDFWDHTTLEGPGQVIVQGNLETIPVLIREGSVIPYQVRDDLHLLFFAPSREMKKNTFTKENFLYSDCGDGEIRCLDDWRVDKFSVSTMNQTILIERSDEGGFPFPYDRIFMKCIGLMESSIFVDNHEIAIQDGLFEVGLFNHIIIHREEG